MICSDVNLSGEIVVAGFSNSKVICWRYLCDTENTPDTQNESENDSDDDEDKKDEKKDDDEEETKEDKEANKDKEQERKDKNIKVTNRRVQQIEFIGHTGPVYAVSICYDSQTLLSCSHDKTIRLWSIPFDKKKDMKQSALVVYKGHVRPVWDVKFSPFGYYFASGSADNTAMLWATDRQGKPNMKPKQK